MIDRETQQKIKDAANIVEVVGDYVKLTRRGANYMGLCPFHNERTPSFSVSPRRNFCHCFSCKKGGSPVNFIMEKEGVNYTEALLILAKKYNIPVRERELSDEERQRMSQREAMVVASEWAMDFFHENLFNSEEGQNVGLAYLYSRGITDEAIRKYKIGYSSDKGDNLLTRAQKEGFDIEIFKEIGLIGTSLQGRDYDKFRGRVMFPIRNSSGKPVAFGGRALKGEAAKYINSPETPLYKKSNELYGIYEAKAEIIKQNRVFLMEGYLDVIGSSQCGIQNAVASSGTALTDSQINLIHRFTDNVTLIYDGDEAGIKASLRGIDMLLAHKLHIKVLLLPDGEDPDSFARKHTPEEFKEYIEKHQTDFIRYKLGVLLKQAGQNPQEISEAIRSIAASIASIPDEIERISYIKECSGMVDFDEKIIAKQVAQALIAKNAIRVNRQLTQQYDTSIVIPKDEKVSEETDNAATLKREKPNFMEREILKYCIRYAYLPIKINDEDERRVISFVKEEMEADGLNFTFNPYKKIFELLLEHEKDFDIKYEQYKKEVEDILHKERDTFKNKLISEGGSMSRLQQEEMRFAEEEKSRQASLYKNFIIGYSVDYLINHESSEVREIANSLIAERHTLSSIYFKGGNVTVLEEDKLNELVPRALSELRSEVLNGKITDLQNKMTEALANQDVEAQEEIMAKLTKLLYFRSRIAGHLGDRIISPR